MLKIFQKYAQKRFVIASKKPQKYSNATIKYLPSIAIFVLMNLEFDKNGFLIPYTKIACNLETLEHIFVENFPKSETRRILFNNYLRYIHDFKGRITRNFTQWVNGSFISQKQNPKDIDFVTFLDYETYENKIDYLDRFWSFSLEDKGLDAYFVKIYPEEHKDFEEMEKQKMDWLELYGTTRKNQDNTILHKGFIELKF